MTTTRKHQVLAVLLLVILCTATFAAEPNPPEKPELKFITSTRERDWKSTSNTFGKGPIRPKYVATFHTTSGFYYWMLGRSELKELLLNTSAGKTMSAEQKDFFTKTQDVTRFSFGSTLNKTSFHLLYAMSQDDAKKMARALIEVLNNPQIRLRIYKNKLASLHKDLQRDQQEFANLEAGMEVRMAIFRKEKLENVPYLTIDEAKKTVARLNEMLNSLAIEEASAQARSKAISLQKHTQEQRIRDRRGADRIGKVGNDVIFLKLEEMSVDLSIELVVIESKIKTASRLRKEAKDFYTKMSYQLLRHKEDILQWKMQIKRTDWEASQISTILKYGEAGLPPVEIERRNRVTISPIESASKVKSK